MMEIAFGLKLGGGPEDMEMGSEQKMGNGHHGHEHDAEGRYKPETSSKPTATPSAAASSKPAPSSPEPKPMETEEDEEAREQKRKRAEATKEKEAGNEAYKKKDFQVAIQHYNKAMELDSSDISFLTNRYICAHCPYAHPDARQCDQLRHLFPD
jgi:stress-induced-phosphoprotein 1